MLVSLINSFIHVFLDKKENKIMLRVNSSMKLIVHRVFHFP